MPDHIRPGWAVAFVIALGGLAALIYPHFSLNHDASWYLVATAMFLDGGELYVDVIEINPPLAFYLTVPPVAAARALGTDPTTTFYLYTIMLALAACAWSFRLLQGADLTSHERAWLLAAVAVALLALPAAEFGQREHLMLIFAMPFLLGLILRPALSRMPRMQQVVLALVGALGLLLKPYFLLIPASIGLMRIIQDRNLRAVTDPGMLALAGAGLSYILFVVLVHPAYFTFIVPVARDVYAAYGTGALAVLARPELIAMLLLFAATYRAPSNSVTAAVAGLFASACLGAAAAYLVQFKGWGYHILPLTALLLPSATWLWLRTSRARPAARRMALLAGAAALMLLGLQGLRGPYHSATTQAFAPFVKPQVRSVLVISTDVAAAFPFVNEVSARWASRYPAQWLIPGAQNRLGETNCTEEAFACRKTREILDINRRALVEDLIAFQPDLVFVDERPRKLFFRDASFNYIEFLSEDPDFSVFARCYRRVSLRAGYGVYARRCPVLPT